MIDGNCNFWGLRETKRAKVTLTEYSYSPEQNPELDKITGSSQLQKEQRLQTRLASHFKNVPDG